MLRLKKRKKKIEDLRGTGRGSLYRRPTWNGVRYRRAGPAWLQHTLCADPGESLCKVPSSFLARCFSMLEHCYFSSAFFQAASPTLPSTNTFLYKQQIVLLLSFSEFGRNSNGLLRLSLQPPFSSAHVDSHSPWLPAFFFPVFALTSPGTVLPLPLAMDHCGTIFTLSCFALQVLIRRG